MLRGLELTPTPARPMTPAAQPSTAPVSPSATVTGTQRVARAFAASLPDARTKDVAPAFPKDGKLHGVALLAAFYAKHA